MKWPESLKEAKEIQSALRQEIVICPLQKKIHYIAGADAAFFENKVIGTACCYTYPEMELIEEEHAVSDVTFPYVPGYLTFREGPAVMAALKKLKQKPDLIIFDGQGIAHRTNMGIAAHLGLLLNTPAIGCAKSRLVGEYSEPGTGKGAYTMLRYNGESVGIVLRTRNNVKPVFISPGHLIDIQDSLEVVRASTGKYRLPEPIRRADCLSKEVKRQLKNG